MHKSILILLYGCIFWVITSCDRDSIEYTWEYIPIPNAHEDMSSYYKQQSDSSLFHLVSPEQSGLHFSNDFYENMSNSFWRHKLVQVGSGVASGDFNNDGLQDLFFVSNYYENKLYLNKGDLKFEDISAKAGIADTIGYSISVSLLDFNLDGWLDIYVSKGGTNLYPEEERRNRLFINNKDLSFTDKAKAYGLDSPKSTSQVNFIDYDLDGDLDIYMVNHWASDKNLNSLKTLAALEKGTNESDQFFRNNGDETFTDISEEVGIKNHGIGWSCSIGDYNGDGWPDIYVACDFVMYNFLYINNTQGGFEQSIFDNLKKMTRFGMGSDAGDINQDGHLDIVVAGIDMQDHRLQKSMFDFTDAKLFDARIASGYHYQRERNTLQLNNGDGTFAEIGAFANVHSTNWTWSTLFEDFDNDGQSDLFVSNGFATPWFWDHRFGKHSQARKAIKAKDRARYYRARMDMPRKHQKYTNEFFRNNGDLSFSKETLNWGGNIPNVSYGAAVADLDNDGDMDIITNNLNQEATLYENRLNQQKANHYLRIQLKGPSANPGGHGARVYLRDQKGQLLQFKHQHPIKGYASTSDYRLHFGLGGLTNIPSVEIRWPDGKFEVRAGVTVDQQITLNYQDAEATEEQPTLENSKLFTRLPPSMLDYQHQENSFDDFDRQSLMHFQQSKNGPSVAVGDINGDQLDDLIFGGAQTFATQLYLQKEDGTFSLGNNTPFQEDRRAEDMGLLLFDADQDGDNDLYICSGGGVDSRDENIFQDRLYLNDGRGNFTKSLKALPELKSSGSVVVANDFDKDGDLDLFVGGRLIPGFYPTTPESFLLQNEGGQFTDVTDQLAPGLRNVGMVTAALWTDHDQDGFFDLMLLGDWMPITIFKNTGGQLQQQKKVNFLDEDGIALKTNGWWNSITGGDFDADGDTDYVLGNIGQNTYYQTSQEEPLELYFDDINKDQQLELFYTYNNGGKQYPVHGLAGLQRMLPEKAKSIGTFYAYAQMEFPEIQEMLEMNTAQKLSAYLFSNVYLENKGEGTFMVHPLPNEAQLSCIKGMVTGDFDQDGYLDILAHGNFHPAHQAFDRQDSGVGFLLKGDGQGNFQVLRGYTSGFFSDEDARGLVLVNRGAHYPLIVACNNGGPADLFQVNGEQQFLALPATVPSLLVKNQKNQLQRIEQYYGSGYLSQSSFYHLIGKEWQVIEKTPQKFSFTE